MPRVDHLWVVMERDDPGALVAFSRRHEMVRWLALRQELAGKRVFRVRDDPRDGPQASNESAHEWSAVEVLDMWLAKSVNYRGRWQPDTSYMNQDVVLSGGRHYITQSVVGRGELPPEARGSRWTVLAAAKGRL